MPRPDTNLYNISSYNIYTQILLLQYSQGLPKAFNSSPICISKPIEYFFCISTMACFYQISVPNLTNQHKCPINGVNPILVEPPF